MRRLSFVFLIIGALPAAGATFTFDSLNRGWIVSDGSANNGQSGNSYFAGIDATDHSGLELRDWFTFDVSTLTGTVQSATLRLETGTVKEPLAITSETYQVTSIPVSFGFADLGTGGFYGCRVYNASDSLTTQAIDLNSDAFGLIGSGGTFSLGGRITTLTQAAVDEAVFTGISGDPANVQLIVVTSDVVGTPEPATCLLGLTGLAAILLRRRR